jgi:hydrogenase nickel incorporation protein HypA/HybF
MHELSAVQGMVETALAKTREVGSPRVMGMHFVVNEGGHVTEESVHLCFTMVANGTPAEGAELHFVWNPPHYRCFECGHEFDGPHEGDHTMPCPQCKEMAALIPPVEEFYLDSIDVK